MYGPVAIQKKTDDRLVDVIRSSSEIRTHLQLLRWMRGDVQLLLPHDILLVAWGQYGSRDVQVDVLSELPGVRTSAFELNQKLIGLLSTLTTNWKRNACAPLSYRTSGWFPSGHGQLTASLGQMRTAQVHGIHNRRDDVLCLYIALSRSPRLAPGVSSCFRELLPHLDHAFSQVVPLPRKPGFSLPSIYFNAGPGILTAREQEVMTWVRTGKTNEVIGQILKISPYTVKNHLKRIFIKLGVSNRAHAVSILDSQSGSFTAGRTSLVSHFNGTHESPLLLSETPQSH